MDRFDLDDDVVAPPPPESGDTSPLKEWRLKHQAGTLVRADFLEFFKKESPKYFAYQNEYETAATKPTLKCMFKEEGAKEAIIDVVVEFMMGENPKIALEKIRLEGSTASVCGKVFRNGEPTYSCRECGMDPTCVLCVNCFKQSAHRYHKYKMSTSGGGGCCDCGDIEAWKKDHFCEEHKPAVNVLPTVPAISLKVETGENEKEPESKVITEEVKERCKIAFGAILSFCVSYLEIEPNASLRCLDGNGDNGDGDEHFCTVLYNDESHTFDQVIQTLTKIAKCRHKDAMEIVAAIDREGRAVVKCDTFKECNDLKTAIENQFIAPSGVISSSRHNISLRTSVLHINSVACQQFGLQLLTWFQEFLVRHFTFRKIFCELIQSKSESFCVRHILEYDVQLWKTARTCWHRLLICGLLMEYKNKMFLAQEFSRRYATIVEDFIHDDHEHSFSIVSLSVQLFTVPSIAHHLIAHEGIFHKLLYTFFHVSIEKFIQNNTLHFSKNIANMAFFKRAAYILYDLRYLLSLKPDIWSDDLRGGFLEGCKGLMRVLHVMQGMESMTRQTGQHMDYEPEWECAFNLHIKLASTISQVIDWAANDLEAIKKLYKLAIRGLATNRFIVGTQKIEERTVAGHVAACLIYDITSKPVSIHLPLSRFYAGVYLHLGAHNLTYDTMLADVSALMGNITPREIIEPVLCTLAMIAQVAAGMWRRNGYSLLHQLYFYRNVRCRTEMLDRDIVVLQIGASLMESNQFLIHMLNKFNLVQWMQPNFEGSLSENAAEDDFVRQLTMVDEFLELLIVIIGERYVPGVSCTVTEKERSQKEIIQLLCIKAYSHSELSRALPDACNDMSIEEIIESVATFKKPQKAESKGVYELKDELYDEFNLYFYHYTKEEKSKAEETQRERRKAKEDLVCCPPPKLPKLTEAFATIANILQCDVFLSILNVVLDRAVTQRSKVFTENHLQKVLHLIGYAMQEEESNHYPFLSFFERANKLQMLNKLEELARCSNIETNRDFILWTIKRWKDNQAKQKPNDEAMQEVGGACADEPLCAVEQAKREKEIRARLAAERRAKIMAQMQSAQKNFIKSNADLFANTSTGTTGDNIITIKVRPNIELINPADKPTTSAAALGQQMDWQTEAASGGSSLVEIGGLQKEPTTDVSCDFAIKKEAAVDSKSIACLGYNRRVHQPEEQRFKCILCFEDCELGSGGSAGGNSGATLVCSAYLQTSRVLYTVFRISDTASMHASSCGHVMHYSCWKEYYNTEEAKEQRRPHRNRLPFSFLNTQSMEFHCPYCRCLSNTVLPVSDPLSKYSKTLVLNADKAIFTMHQWWDVMETFSNILSKLRPGDDDPNLWFYAFPGCENVLTTACGDVKPMKANMSETEEKLWAIMKEQEYQHHFEQIAQIICKPALHESWSEVMACYVKCLRMTAMPQCDVSDSDSLRLLWESCSYSIRSLDVFLRATNKLLTEEMSMRHKSCASNLVRACSLYAANLTQNDVKNLVKPVAQLLKTVFNQSGDCVLEWDCFTMMVEMIFTVPNMLLATDMNRSIIANGSMMDFYTMQLFFLAHMVKAIVSFKYTAPATDDSTDMGAFCGMDVDCFDPDTVEYVQKLSPEIKENIISFYSKYNLNARENQYNTFINHVQTHGIILSESDFQLSDVQIEANEQTIVALFEHIRTEVRIFLRCVCIFFHFMTDVEFPSGLEVMNSDNFASMCSYLGLNPELGSYFMPDSVQLNLLEKFAKHKDIVSYDFSKKVKANGEPMLVEPCIRPTPVIVDLPDDYSDLINSVSEFICPNSEREEMKSPTMCLICGAILCGQSYCCQPELGSHTVGACTFHAHNCGAEVGIFLRIRDCQVVYLGRGKGCFVQPPYLDEYGETDQGLRRGNPLRLCTSAYNKVYLHWLGHSLHEEIARLNDNANIAVTQWHHM